MTEKFTLYDKYLPTEESTTIIIVVAVVFVTKLKVEKVLVLPRPKKKSFEYKSKRPHKRSAVKNSLGHSNRYPDWLVKKKKKRGMKTRADTHPFNPFSLVRARAQSNIARAQRAARADAEQDFKASYLQEAERKPGWKGRRFSVSGSRISFALNQSDRSAAAAVYSHHHHHRFSFRWNTII